MKRNMFVIMVLVVGALLVFTIDGHCRTDVRSISGDPHDEGVGITASARQHSGEPLYLRGDPHTQFEEALTRPSNRVETMYISGDPHDHENFEKAVPVAQEWGELMAISGDPHNHENFDGVLPVVRRPVVTDYISGDPHE